AVNATSDFMETAATETGEEEETSVPETQPYTSVKRPKKYWRFLMLALSTLCITQILANQNSYNFTKICVSNKKDPSANYTKNEQSVIQAGTAIGSFSATIPMMFALDRLPKKHILLACGALSSVATLFVPFMEPLGFYYFLAARIFQGVAFCVTFPIAGAVTAEWASLTEHGIFLAFLTGFSQLANIYLMPVSGVMCTYLGWKWVYYTMGVTGSLFFFLFFCFYTDFPVDNEHVTPEELAWILKDKPEKPACRDPVPYMAMLKSKVIWAVWTSAFADILAIMFINMFNPQYINDYLKFSVLKTGFYAALPILVQWFCKIFAGFSSDFIKGVSETMKLKIYNTIALGASGTFFIILSFIPAESAVACFVVLIITEGLIGFNTAGFNKCGTLHARQHSHFVMIMKVNIQSTCQLIEPFITNAIITDNTAWQWRWVFWLHASLLIATTVLFLFWAKADAAPWTEPPQTEEVSVEDVETNGEESQAEIPDSTAPTEQSVKEAESA
ncbi:hypothetical protein PENTCL1PPCAC_24807, partial [Pristionchus entomophagus]